jgi:polar amino acid transport system substrate-binding protein
MIQVVQYQKDGRIISQEMPAPLCPENGILVETKYSLISAGTEKSSVTNAQGSLIERAKKQPEQVKLVVDTIKKQGLLDTYQRVKNKLDSFKALGYSASGVVVESRCDEFSVGDRVACAGAGLANHAEFIAIPKNLAVKIPNDVSFEDASFTTVASIAMQGVRQCSPLLGETIIVMGLGLIGQITVQLLKANGCKVIGLDVNESLFAKAKEFGCDLVLKSSKESLNQIIAFSNGNGVDSTIITASTSSSEPLQLAMEGTRQRGSVVIVGAIGMNLERQPFYKKEIDLKIACSYGPGRYDAQYEDLGNDYPFAFVRWTENRNMQAVIDLLAAKKLNFNSLTTHTFKASEAEKAYQMITSNSEPFIGILLDFENEKSKLTRITKQSELKPTSDVKIGFIGLGQFAQNYLVPPLKKLNVDFVTVANSTPINSTSIAKAFQFANSSTDGNEVIQSKDVNLVFCASRHKSHGQYVINALKANKTIYVEKPLCTTVEELELIADLQKSNVMVGFNRRFSESFKEISNFFEQRKEPMVINYRVNAGFIPKNHWVQHSEEGGRIIGEVCHFIDTMIFLTKANPIRVYAESISSTNDAMVNRDNVTISIKFDDGSLGTILYLANGDNSLAKEYCEVFCEKSTAIMDNFDEVKLYRSGKLTTKKKDGKKGINEEINLTVEAFRKGKPMPIPFEEIYLTTKTTILAIQSLESGFAQVI